MFGSKLSIRIGLVVAAWILAIGIVIAFFGVSAQKKAYAQKRRENIQLAVSLFSGQIERSIQRDRYVELTKNLMDLSARFDAYSFTLFSPAGRTIIHQDMKDNYHSQTADLKAQLVAARGLEVPIPQKIRNEAGEVSRYIVPIKDGNGPVLAGVSLETPSEMNGFSAGATILWVAGIMLFIVVFVTAVVILEVSHFVLQPLMAMKVELAALSKGEADLTYEITVQSNDEIGEMARWFNAFIKHIRLMVSRVKEHSQHLSEQVQSMTHSTAEVGSMGEDVSTTIQQIAKGAEEQASKIAEVSHLMQEMQEGMKEVEKKAHETSDAVDKATQTARAGGRMARGTIDKMVQLSGVILTNSDMVGRLGAKSQQIGRVVEIINGIAEQTNLLSLNAAIEAARAGEQGRGFAVVAEEVRTLADGASKATQEIANLIQQIQDETSAVVDSMEKSAREAQSSKEGIKDMEGVLDEIVTVIENVVQYSLRITEMIGQQSQRYNKIVHSIQEINAVSEESAASTEEVSASTEQQTASMDQVNATFKELAAMAEELKTMVEKFKIR